MKLEDISKSMRNDQVSIAEGDRGAGSEAIFIIKSNFTEINFSSDEFAVEIISSVFNVSGINPAVVLIRLNGSKKSYALWIDVCDSKHRNLIEMLSIQKGLSFALLTPENVIINVIGIENTIKEKFENLLSATPKKGWDKLSFHNTVDGIVRSFGKKDLWDSIFSNAINDKVVQGKHGFIH